MDHDILIMKMKGLSFLFKINTERKKENKYEVIFTEEKGDCFIFTTSSKELLIFLTNGIIYVLVLRKKR